MSRLHSKSNRGRQPAMAAPRLLKTKDISDDTYQEPTSRRNRGAKNSKFATITKRVKPSRRADTPSSSELSDDFDGDEASDEQSESEDDDDDDDLPIAHAPSRQLLNGGAGRHTFYEKASRAGSVESMFGENLLDTHDSDLPTVEDMRKFEETLFATASDDDVYGAVDDISESDEEAVAQHEEQQLLAELSEDELEEDDLLNQIDGMSAYGFGDESDAAPYAASSHGSDTASDIVPARHVRFDVDHAHAFPTSIAESPTFSRALLPSAMPETRHLLGTDVPVQPEDDAVSEADSYDSDATDDDLPPEALLQQDDEDEPVTPKQPKERKLGEARGPPRGIFYDEGTKASGMLDKTGKVILITHPHLLGEEFARRYGDSTASSPVMGLEDMFSESDAADTPDFASAGELDMMLHNMNGSVDGQGIVTGPQEAFFPPGLQGNIFMEQFGISMDDNGDLGEDNININDIIKFDEETDDSEIGSPMPIFSTPRASESSHHKHLSNMSASTVTAFRRHQESFKTTPSFNRFHELSSPQSAMTSKSRKRKADESPYASAHYKGVTPVQRMTNPTPHAMMPSTPDTVRPKRQRIMTIS